MRERVSERWVEPEEMLHASSKSMREAHQSAVANIADEYFGYPTPQYPHFRTFVNEPDVSQTIFTNFGRELSPDIVVLEWPEKLVRIVAEVTTPPMLTDANAESWAVLARLDAAQFYLYVPAGHASDARTLLKRHKIKGVTLRTWRNILGLRTIEIAKVR